MLYEKLDYTLSESAKEYLDRLPKYNVDGLLDETEDNFSRFYYGAVSKALELLDIGDRLEIASPNLFGVVTSEAYVVIFRDGRKKLRYTERKPRKGHKTIVLSLNVCTTEGERNGLYCIEVKYTWDIREKRNGQ